MAPKTSCGSKKITDNSLDLDDSGTDALYIALDEADAAEKQATSPDRPSTEGVTDLPVKSEPKDHSKQIKDSTPEMTSEIRSSKAISPVRPSHPCPAPSFHRTPLISEYPPPFLPPYVLPPPIISFYPPHTMFHPHMMSAPHPALLPYQPPLHQHLPPRPNWDLDFDGDCKVRISADSIASASPTDSGVSTSSSPSPTRSISSPSTPQQMSPDTPKSYRRTPGGRTSYTSHQVRVMERVFSENRYPDYDLLEKMSADLGIPAKKIKVWFQNKRARNKTRFANPTNYNMSPHGYRHPGLMTSLPVPVPTQLISFPVILS